MNNDNYTFPSKFRNEKSPQSAHKISKLTPNSNINSSNLEQPIFLRYNQEQITNTINFSCAILEKNNILLTVNEKFNEYFSKYQSNKKNMMKFLLFKTINPPVYPNDYKESSKRKQIDQESLPFYLNAFFFYFKKLLKTKLFNELIKRKDDIATIIIELCIKFINEYAYVNVERRAYTEYKFGRKISITKHQELEVDSTSLSALIIEFLYSFKKDGIVTHLPQAGDCLIFNQTGTNFNVESIEIKSSIFGLFEGRSPFLTTTDSGIKIKGLNRDDTESVDEIEYDGIRFNITKLVGIFLSKFEKISAPNNEEQQYYEFIFKQFQRNAKIRPKNTTNEDFIKELPTISAKLDFKQLFYIVQNIFNILIEINILEVNPEKDKTLDDYVEFIVGGIIKKYVSSENKPQTIKNFKNTSENKKNKKKQKF